MYIRDKRGEKVKMDSKYIITSSGNFINADELYHWGVKGMK